LKGGWSDENSIYIFLFIPIMWIITIFHKSTGLDLSTHSWYGLVLFITYTSIVFISIIVGVELSMKKD
jgi:hypothetical protein